MRKLSRLCKCLPEFVPVFLFVLGCTTAHASDLPSSKNLIVVAVGDRAKIESGLQQLNLGPIEIRNESGDLVKK